MGEAFLQMQEKQVIFLEILLIVCNVLIFNIYRVSEMEKETKWKQQNQETPK